MPVLSLLHLELLLSLLVFLLLLLGEALLRLMHSLPRVFLLLRPLFCVQLAQLLGPECSSTFHVRPSTPCSFQGTLSALLLDRFAVLHEAQDLWPDQHVLDSFRKVDVANIVQAGVVLNGLTIELHQFVHCVDVEVTALNEQLEVEYQLCEVLRQLDSLVAYVLP